MRDGVLSVGLVRGFVPGETGGVIALLTELAAAFGVPAVLTVQGQRRRGRGIAVALLAGAFFPLAWAVWYVADERPYGAS